MKRLHLILTLCSMWVILGSVFAQEERVENLPDGAIVRLGKGSVGHGDRAVAFSPDGRTLAVATAIGVSLYDVRTTREIARFIGPEGGGGDVVFSPDGTILASVTRTQIALWDVKTRRNIGTLVEDAQVRYGIRALTFSPDGTRLASASRTQIKLWDIETRAEIMTLKGHTDRIESVAFSPDGQLLASGATDDTVKLWNIETGGNIAKRFKRFAARRQIATLRGNMSGVESVAFSPDGTILAVGSVGRVNLWDVETKQHIETLGGGEDEGLSFVNAVRFSPDGTVLASASSDSLVRLWAVSGRSSEGLNASSSQATGSFGVPIVTLHGHEGGVYAVAFSPDGTMLASASSGGGSTKSRRSSLFADPAWNRSVKLWALTPTPASEGEPKPYQQVATLPEHTGEIRAVWFSLDGTTIASESGDKIRLWDVETGQYIDTLPKYTNPGNPKVFIAWDDDTPVQIRETATERTIATLEAHTGKVSGIAYSPDGTTLALGSKDGTVRLWAAETGRLLTILKGDMGAVTGVKLSPDGKTAITMSASEDPTESDLIKLWNAERGLTIATLDGMTHWKRAITYSSDGKHLAAPSRNNTIGLWDADRGLKIAKLIGHTDKIWTVAFSPDGTILASGSKDGAVRLWDVETGHPLETLWHSWYVFTVAFSPDGTLLASGSGDLTIGLWEVKTGRQLARLRGHGDLIWTIAFSPDGSTLASGSSDGTVLLWDVSALTEPAK